MSYICSDDNIRLYVQDLCPNNYNGQTVVFVHGWPFDHTVFDYQVVPLAELGYRCVSVDLRGFGKSDSPGRGYNYNQMSDDLHRVVRQLNLRRFTLVGLCMGAGVCARYMRRYQGYCVDRLCFVAGALPQFVESIQNPCGVPESGFTGLVKLTQYDRPQAVSDYIRNSLNLCHGEEFLRWLDNVSFNASAIGTNFSLQALRDENCRQDLDSISVPTAIFHGAYDKVCPLPMAELTQSLIPGSRLFVYPESGHLCNLDEVSAFNTDLVEFISRC